MRPNHLGEIFSVLCALLWSSAVILFRKSGEQIPPVALNVFKNAFALVLFVITLLFLQIPFFPADRSLHHWIVLLLSGAVGIGIADSLFFASLNRLGATGSAIVDCAYTPSVVLCAIFLLGERVHLSLLLAMALMVSALWIGTEEPPLSSIEFDPRLKRTGLIYGILSMFLMAAGIVFAKPVLNTSEIWWATLVRLVGGQALLTAQSLLPKHRESVLRTFAPSRQWLFTLPSATLGSYLAMVIWLAGMKYTQASIAGILNQTSTFFVPLLAAIFLGESLTRRKGIAVLLGFLGALIVML